MLNMLKMLLLIFRLWVIIFTPRKSSSTNSKSTTEILNSIKTSELLSLNFGNISYLFLVFLLLNSYKKKFAGSHPINL